MDVSGKSKQLLGKNGREFGKEYYANFACGFSQFSSTILKKQALQVVRAIRPASGPPSHGAD